MSLLHFRISSRATAFAITALIFFGGATAYWFRHYYGRLSEKEFDEPIEFIEVQPYYGASMVRISAPQDIQAIRECVIHSSAPRLGVSYPAATCHMRFVFRSGNVMEMMVSATTLDGDNNTQDLNYAVIRWQNAIRVCRNQPFSGAVRKVIRGETKG